MPIRVIQPTIVSDEKTVKVDPLKEPQFVTPQDIIGVAIPKKSDMPFAKYGFEIAKDEETGLKFMIATTKTKR